VLEDGGGEEKGNRPRSSSFLEKRGRSGKWALSSQSRRSRKGEASTIVFFGSTASKKGSVTSSANVARIRPSGGKGKRAASGACSSAAPAVRKGTQHPKATSSDSSAHGRKKRKEPGWERPLSTTERGKGDEVDFFQLPRSFRGRKKDALIYLLKGGGADNTTYSLKEKKKRGKYHRDLISRLLPGGEGGEGGIQGCFLLLFCRGKKREKRG